MTRSLATLCLVVCCSIVGENVLLAQGKGAGYSRGLSSAASRAASAGRSAGRASAAMSHASRPSAGTTNRVSKGAYRLPPAGTAVRRPVPAKTASMKRPSSTVRTSRDHHAGLAEATDNPQRILQHRMQQAEHLRTVSDRNGNDALQQTADRMEASATTNFERQSLQLSAPNGEIISEAEPASDSVAEPVEGSMAPPSTTAVPKPKANAAAKRGFWLRSR